MIQTIGKVKKGEAFSDKDCRVLMELPMLDFTKDGRRSRGWLSQENF